MESLLRRTTPVSPYSRYVAFNGFKDDSLKEKSLLAGFAAMEAPFMRTVAVLAGVIETEGMGYKLSEKNMPTGEDHAESFRMRGKLL